PTVQTLGSLAGEIKLTSPPLLPAATARKTPASTAAAAAALMASDLPPPRLMLPTVPLGHSPEATRCGASFATNSSPAITDDAVPDPPALSTLTANSLVFLATPYVLPPIVPATCVP